MSGNENPVTIETWKALLKLAAEFFELKPWIYAADCDLFGIRDATTGEVRIGHVLGNANEVFAVVIYRKGGRNWVFSLLEPRGDPNDLDQANGMDCLKLEWVTKRELEREDLAMLKRAGFKTTGRGAIWPQFRSFSPGWHPWGLGQDEALQLLADLPQLLAGLRLYKSLPNLFDDRAPQELPFIQGKIVDRMPLPEDLEWMPYIPSPLNDQSTFKLDGTEIENLRKLTKNPSEVCEFDSMILPGASFMEGGRPCFGRISLLVDSSGGLIHDVKVESAAVPAVESAVRALATHLFNKGSLPGILTIASGAFAASVQALGAELGIRIVQAEELYWLDEALAHLNAAMAAGEFPP